MITLIPFHTDNCPVLVNPDSIQVVKYRREGGCSVHAGGMEIITDESYDKVMELIRNLNKPTKPNKPLEVKSTKSPKVKQYMLKYIYGVEKTYFQMELYDLEDQESVWIVADERGTRIEDGRRNIISDLSEEALKDIRVHVPCSNKIYNALNQDGKETPKNFKSMEVNFKSGVLSLTGGGLFGLSLFSNILDNQRGAIWGLRFDKSPKIKTQYLLANSLNKIISGRLSAFDIKYLLSMSPEKP